MGLMLKLTVVAAAMAAGYYSTGGAQEAVQRVKYKVECTTCRVEFTPIATVGRRSDAANLAVFSRLDRDSQGRFFGLGDNFQVLVYDARGNFLKALGRRGDGPGEFNVRGSFGFIHDVVVGRGDTVVVFNPPRVVVFSPGLAHVRTFNIGFWSNFGSVFPLADGSWVFSAQINTRGAAGRALHVMRPDGTIRQSIGPETAVAAGRIRPSAVRMRLAPDRTSLWIYSTNHRYSLDSWTTNNEHLTAFQFEDVPYLPEPKYTTVTGRTGTPIRTVVGAEAVVLSGIDRLGQLWMMGQHGKRDSLTYILEIVDPSKRQVVSSQTMPVFMSLLRTGDFAISKSTDDDGFVSFTVWSYRFVGR